MNLKTATFGSGCFWCTEAIFEISTEGLAKLEFKVDDYTSTYFLVASEDLD